MEPDQELRDLVVHLRNQSKSNAVVKKVMKPLTFVTDTLWRLREIGSTDDRRGSSCPGTKGTKKVIKQVRDRIRRSLSDINQISSGSTTCRASGMRT